MTKQFSGFTQQQTEILARKMGFNGPMDQFSNFLRSDPAHSQKFASYEDKAKMMVASSQEKRGFAEGGDVQSGIKPTSGLTPEELRQSASAPAVGAQITNDEGKVVTNYAAPNMNSTGMQTTNNMLDNPTDYVTNVNVQQGHVSQNELINPNSGQVGNRPNIVAATGTTATAAAPTTKAANTVTTANVTPGIQDAVSGMSVTHGTVQDHSLVEAAQGQPSDDATVQGQLNKLMQQFEGGNKPAWAAGAMRMADAVMAARGLGASSMAGSAVTQAAMESAINIAAQDASTFAQFEMKNLDNRQQARLQNAQSFLTMDLKNLDADQQNDLFKSQAIINGLFTDAAAENATKQFNATSKNQTDQFFANLKTQVATFNAAQKNTMRQFNAGEINDTRQFNRQMNDARAQFNAANRLLIDQSNATWRRAITTANNEAINEANRQNAQAATGFTTAAYNNLMLREQDAYTFAFQAGENAQQRNHELVVGKIAAKDSASASAWQAVSGFAGRVFDGIFDQ